jgi:hypothetical protein
METGIGLKNPLFFIGVIEDNDDPRKEGRVRVRVFGAHGTLEDIPTEDLPWATMIKGDYDPNGFVPLNSFVFGFFVDGREAQYPMILGLIPSAMAEPITYAQIAKQGWGVIPEGEGSDRRAAGSTPTDVNQPQMSREARGEYVEETYVVPQAINAVEEIKIAGSEETWAEPAPAYNAQYGYNRVIKTTQHTIELDDTPGAERINITHGTSGAYVQIDSRGTVAHKTTGTKYDVNDQNQHIYVGGKNIVTIMGDSYVYVDGNKIEEIKGDYQQIIRGNARIGVGGQYTLNVSDQIQARAADVKIEADTGTLSIYAEKEMQIEAGIGMYRKAPFLWDQATSNMNIRANNLNMSADTDLNIRANDGNLNLFGGADVSMLSDASLQVESNGNISVTASSTVYINDYVSMAEGGNDSATEAVYSEESISAARVEAPEPPAKSTATTSEKANRESLSTTGITSQDEGTLV